MQVKCLIIDDEPPAQRVIEKFVHEIPSLALEGKCFNTREALGLLHKKNIDLIFLDINMPIMSGLEFLRTLQNPPLVIITTAYREYALDGYELNVVDYLTKPITFTRFFQAVDKAMNRLNSRTQQSENKKTAVQEPSAGFIFVKDDKTTYKIDLEHILYIESMGDYVKIITNEKNYIAGQTMKRMEEILPAERFPRVHKSYIVALRHIKSITGNRIKLTGGVIPIGKTYRKAFFDLLDSFR